jgi:hypothetical protein
MNRIGFFSLRSKDPLDYLRFAPVIQVLLRGPYPKPLRRYAASGIFIPSLLKASFQRSEIKKPLRLRRKGFVNRIGFEPMACCLEGSCSIQLSYRSLNSSACADARKNNVFMLRKKAIEL